VPEPHRLFRLRDPRHVRPDRPLQGEGELGSNPVRGSLRPPQPPLLVDGEVDDELVGELLLGQDPQRLSGHKAPRPVVERLPRHVPLLKPKERVVDRRWVADVHAERLRLVPAAGPDVHEQVVERNDLVPVPVRLDVGRGAPDDPVDLLPAPGEDREAVGHEDPVVPSAEGGEAEEPVLLDPLHHEPHLVHVRIEHHRVSAPPRAGEVPEGVRLAALHVRGDHPVEDFPHLVLKPCHPERIGQLL